MTTEEEKKIRMKLPIIDGYKLMKLRTLITDVEADFGCEYSIDKGMKALIEMRAILGGEPHTNVKDWEV